MAGILRSILRLLPVSQSGKHLLQSQTFSKKIYRSATIGLACRAGKNHSESEEEDDIDVHQPLVKYILMRSPKSCRRMTATLKARRGSSWCPTPGLQPLIIAIRSTHPTCPNSDLLLLDLPQREKVLNSGGLRSDLFLWDWSCSLCHESLHRSGKELLLLFLRPS